MSGKSNSLSSLGRKRAAIYIRVSTTTQSLDGQLHTLRQFAKQRGMAVVQEYSDVASGAKRERKALKQLMEDAAKRKFDYCLVFRFDRFARSSVHLIQALSEFRRFGIGFISYSENIDTGSPLGEAIFTICAAMAQLERDIIKERVINGIAHAKAMGKKLGRPARLDHAEVRKLRSGGATLSQIAKALGTTKSVVSKILLKRVP